MSTESREVVLQIHRSLGLNSPSQHTVQHMAAAVDVGSVNPGCLRASLVRSDAYRTSIRSRFRDSCYALLGEDDEVSFKKFDTALTAVHSEPVEVSDAVINQAVRASARFESRYVDLVRRNYSMLMTGEQPSETFTADIVGRFRDEPAFTLEHLHQIIRALPSPVPIPNLAGHSNDPDASHPQETDTPDETSCIHTHLTEGSAPATLPSIPKVEAVDPETIRQILLVADHEYGRPWYALELVAYGVECAAIKDPATLLTHMSTLLQDHAVAWEKARGAHAHLLGDVLDEIDFVRKYVGRHRAQEFCASLPSEILSSPLYENRITNRLMVVQKRLYDVALDDEEVARLFLQAQAAGVGVSDDEVSSLLHAHRRECDALVSEVVNVFVEILNREPDHNELREEVVVFRDSGAVVMSESLKDAECLSAAKIELAVRLSKGFEFHDVIKTRLRSAYHHAHGGVHVPMQALYLMLERVLLISETTLRSRGCVNGVAAIVDQEIRRTSELPC